MSILAGAGFGASQALHAEQERKLREFQITEAARIAQEALLQRQAEEANQQAARMKTLDLADLRRRDENNARGIDLMRADKQQMDTDAAISGLPPHLKKLEGLMRIGMVPKLAPEDMQTPEERANALKAQEEREIRIRRASIAPQTPKQREQVFVVRDGKPIPIEKGTAQPGDLPYDEVGERQKAKTENIHPQVLEYSRGVIRKIDDLIGREDDPATPENETRPNRITHATAGMGGAIRRWSPFNNAAKDVDAELFSLTSELAISALQKMRASSQTGGAVGNVALGEMEIMKNAEAAIRSDQSPANLRRQLGIVRESEQRFLDAVEKDQGSSAGGSFSVTAPNGKTYNFASAAELAAFKKRAGIP